MWIFGYGSLVWKVDFPYEEKVVGYIKGYSRRFWQASVDHRGIPEKPGRVVTLVKSEDPEDCVWGVAYNISQEQKKDVLIYLDYREKGGYERTHVMFHPKDTNMKPWMLMIYVGTTDNPFYRGPADDDAVASIIAESVGPSGSNAEYLLNLFVAMDAIGGLDDHLRNLQEKVQNLKRLKI